MANNRTYTDPITEQMIADGLPFTRENYIAMNWSQTPDPWLPEHEAQLPTELQNWSMFQQGQQHG